MNNLLPVSVCVIAYNEETNIADCLESALGYAAEVVVLDASSTDRTADIIQAFAKKHPEIVALQEPNTIYYNVNKAKTFKAARQPWLFYLDADERMTKELWQEIAKVLPDTTCAGFRVGRKNYYLGQWMRFGGMYPEKQPRLFRKGSGTFSLNHVHETLQIKGEVGELTQDFLHYSYQNVSQFLQKMDTYTTFQAELWRKKGIKWSGLNHLRYAVLRPVARFGQKYFVQQGFRDGLIGFFAACLSGYSEFIAYMKVYEPK